MRTTTCLRLVLALLVIALNGVTIVRGDDGPRKAALLVGVNKYLKPGFAELHFAEADVTAVAEELKTLGFDVTLLLGSGKGDQRATRKNIEKAARKMVQPLGRDDVALVMLSGHGQQLSPDGGGAVESYEKGESYFCPVDAVMNEPQSLFKLSLLIDDILARNVGRKIVIVDACREVPVDFNRGARAAKGIAGRVISLPEGAAIFFSCQAGQQSYERHEVGHGLFTYCLLEGLRGEAADDGEIAWSRLVDHVGRRMTDEELRALMPSRRPQVPIPAGAMPYTVLGRSSRSSSTAPSIGGGMKLRPEDTAGEKDLKLALQYYEGVEAPSDIIRAKRHFERAAEQGNPIAKSFLGDYYLYGLGQLVDEQVGTDYYVQAAVGLERLAAAGDSNAQLQLGWILIKGLGIAPRPQQGRQWLEAAAKQGNLMAIVTLGYCHHRGLVGPENPEAAVEKYQQAADGGLPDAYLALGEAYRDGAGVDADPDKALEYFRKGAERNQARCQVEVAAMLMEQGDEASMQEAVELFRKASQQNDALAYDWLGYCCRDGLGVEQDDDLAVHNYVQSAALGSASALNAMGWLFIDERVSNPVLLKQHVPELAAASTDNERARICFELAGERGDDTAYDGLGMIYRDGLGVEEDRSEATRYFRVAAEAGFVDSQYSLGEMLVTGGESAQQIAEGRSWIKQAIDNGFEVDDEQLEEIGVDLASLRNAAAPEMTKPSVAEAPVETTGRRGSTAASAEYTQALAAYHGLNRNIDRREAARLLERASKAGNVLATAHLAIMMLEGDGVRMDTELARETIIEVAEELERLSDAGNVDASILLGVVWAMLGTDESIERDGVDLVREQADRGNAWAMYWMGRAYESETGAPLDYDEARSWWVRASQGGSADADVWLGTWYDTGVATQPDHKQAARYYLRAANRGLAEGQYNYGGMCHRGAGVQKRLDTFFRWTKIAAEKGHTFAQSNLGYAYWDGLGVEQDTDLALHWFERAANGQNTIAWLFLAEAYEQGNGVAVDLDKAWKWYRIAADFGDEDGIAGLERLKSRGVKHRTRTTIGTVIRMLASESSLVLATSRGNLQTDSLTLSDNGSREVVQLEAERSYRVEITGSNNLVVVPKDYEPYVQVRDRGENNRVLWEP